MDLDANADTYQVGAHFEALDEGVLQVPLDSRYTQVELNLASVQVCTIHPLLLNTYIGEDVLPAQRDPLGIQVHQPPQLLQAHQPVPDRLLILQQGHNGSCLNLAGF